jgi:hypothetical protein
MPTIEERKLKFIGRVIDRVRNAVIDFYIEPSNAPGPRQSSGMRSLIARHESGGPKTFPWSMASANLQPAFLSGGRKIKF